MIKCEDYKVNIKGTKREIIIELMTLVNFIMNKGIADRDEILEDIIFALMTSDELKGALIDAIDNMDNIGDALTLLKTLE